MKTINNNKGFTIIELMIAVAIIGILAAIAVPAYSNYTAKARVGAALQAASGIQTAVAECFHTNGNLTNCNGDGNSGSIPANGLDLGQGVGTLTSVAAGVITLSVPQPGVSVILTPTENAGSINWQCTATAESGATITQAQLPSNCTLQ